jgi:replicative DNA helicase
VDDEERDLRDWAEALPVDLRFPVDLPKALEVERAILGVLVLEPQKTRAVAAELVTEDFYLERHRWVFDGLKALGPQSGMVPLSEWLDQRGLLSQIGGLAFLVSLEASLPDPGSLPEFVRIVKDRAWRRRGIELGLRSVKAFETQTRPAQEISAEMAAGYREITGESQRGGFRQLGDILEDLLTELEGRQEQRFPESGLSAGIPELDELIGGMERRHMWLVGARPGVGKTSMLLQIAAREALDEGRHVAVFSLEMDERELVLRLAGQRLGLDTRRARRGQLAQPEWTDLIRFTREARWRGTLHVDQQSRIDVASIGARIQELASRVPLAAVFVDYLTLVKGQGREEKRYARVAEVAEELAGLAKSENVKMVVAAQLSRDSSKNSKKPRLADLREAGEEPAWGVVLLHREEKTNGDAEWLAPETEFIVAKNRTGSTGLARGRFHGPTQRFLPEIP